MKRQWFCYVEATKEVYKAYYAQLVTTTAYEKGLSTKQAEAVLESLEQGERLRFQLEACWWEAPTGS